MATNKGRVIWGYLDANGNIVEEYANPAQEMHDFIYSNETEFHPSWKEISTTTPVTPTTTPTITNNYFPNAEAYGLQAQGYANQWNNAMANAYWSIANSLWRYSTFANNSLNNYDALLNYLQQNETWLQNVAWKTYNTLVGDIQNQRDYINRMFGPNGELTKEVNTYYDDLGNYLSTEAWRQAANIAAQGVHSWASLWAIRAQQNEAYNEAFGRYIQAKEQQINAKQQIASNLINYMATLRQEYWDTTNQYIIDLYKRANDMYNSVAQSAAADLNQYNQLLATPVSTGTTTPQYTYDAIGNMYDSNGRLVATKEEIDRQNALSKIQPVQTNSDGSPIYGPYTWQRYPQYSANSSANQKTSTYAIG